MKPKGSKQHHWLKYEDLKLGWVVDNFYENEVANKGLNEIRLSWSPECDTNLSLVVFYFVQHTLTSPGKIHWGPTVYRRLPWQGASVTCSDLNLEMHFRHRAINKKPIFFSFFNPLRQQRRAVPTHFLWLTFKLTPFYCCNSKKVLPCQKSKHRPKDVNRAGPPRPSVP